MLDRAAQRIAAHAGTGDELPPHVRLVQADVFALPFEPGTFTTVLGLGVTHLFDDTATLVAAARAPLTTDGDLYLAGLTAQTRRGRGYLRLLHRAGEVARPRTAAELRAALGAAAKFDVTGCMAYATLDACPMTTPI
jgi:hypothetical protein